ncbi:archaetidylserine decarboxylase [Thauera aromatica]|uniref:archaetidylserine decarboxylase n=1 Tax=Thauera aromatica TaxID=59405 RepID=UPI001FFD9008|nr:archaetidylserine decarboxylase [Thauera aromatica]MCK2087676.1 archaetidylserine decarboxylase [Thauera aromatica]MCK2126901.1 archaetidylserine decarboxylase [Thauera aromatica]
MYERLFVALQHVLPKKLLTRCAGRLAGMHGGRATAAFIGWFVRRYGVDLNEAADPDPGSYACFNDFFSRSLRPGARPLADADFLCPVDGAISQFGPIERDQIFQAKGHAYSTAALVGGDRRLAARFEDGEFATLYLSPKDYHRIHMPCAGELLQMTYVPGELFSVNPATARGVPGLFARNERVVCVFEGEFGPFAMVLVGAAIVGSMATAWHGVVNPPRRPDIEKRSYADGEVVLARGEEMGRFLLGSTVVLLFPKGVLRFSSEWGPARAVRMGEAMAQLRRAG